MQFQVQKMVSKDPQQTQRESDAMDLYVGLKTGLDDPFNIFLRLSDISSNKELIYFYAYSFGKKKVVLWGVYNINNNEFLIDNACRYSPNDLKYMLDTWKTHDYNFYFSSVRNRITNRMNQELLFDNRKYEMELFNTFKDYFLVKLARTGSMSPKLLSKNLTNLYSMSEEEFNIQYSKILNKISQEVSNLLSNKYVDINQYIFKVLFEEIENKEEEMIVRRGLERSINLARLDPSLANLVKYLLTNVFVCIFADMNEYRAAKYILYLNDNDQGEKIRELLKGNFFYEWILEIARILKIYNLKSFVNKYALEAVNLIEKKINQSDVGVIGVKNKGKTVLVENISIFFEDFISKSKYSKISYTNDLSICPDPKSCVNEPCEVYDHGFKTTSQYDLT